MKLNFDNDKLVNMILKVNMSEVLNKIYLGLKDDIVNQFFNMIPDFGHKETGKYLDGKM